MNRQKLRPWTTILAVALCASGILNGCGMFPTEAEPAPVHLQILESDPFPDAGSDTAVVVPMPGGLEISGRITTPYPCYELTPEFESNGDELTIRIVARWAAGIDACIAVVGFLPYRAELRDLAAGEYAVTVVHTYPGTGWPDRIVTRVRVRVP